MKVRPLGITAQVGGLALLATLSALGAAFAIMLLMPTPAVRPLTVDGVASMVAAPGWLGWDGATRRRIDAPPGGVRSPTVERALTGRLGLPPDRVVAVWRSDIPGASAQASHSVMRLAGMDALVSPGRDGFELRAGPEVDLPGSTVISSLRIAVRDGTSWWLVEADRPALHTWRVRMLVALLLSAVLIIPAVWLTARRLTRPALELARLARAARLDAPMPLSPGGPREIREVAESLVAMHARISDDARERNRMIASIAHDLRNPLAALRIRLEGNDGPDRAAMVRDVERMSRLVSEALEYVRGGRAPCGPVGGTIDLREVVEACASDARLRGGQVEVQMPRVPVPVSGNPRDFERVLGNLLENATRYAGRARVRLAAHGGWVELEVADDGPGIPTEALARMLEPFERMETSRNRDTGGTGLGLAIARDIVKRNGGTLRLRNARPRGLLVHIRLPVSPRPEAPGAA